MAKFDAYRMTEIRRIVDDDPNRRVKVPAEGNSEQTAEYKYPVHFPKGTRYYSHKAYAASLNRKIKKSKCSSRRGRTNRPPKGVMKVRESLPEPSPAPDILAWGLSPQEIMHDIEEGTVSITKDGKPRQRRYRGGAKRGPKPKGVSGGSI